MKDYPRARSKATSALTNRVTSGVGVARPDALLFVSLRRGVRRRNMDRPSSSNLSISLDLVPLSLTKVRYICRFVRGLIFGMAGPEKKGLDAL